MSLRSSEHFIDPDSIITVDDTTPLYKVYQQLADRRSGGLILTEDGRATDYIKTAKLAETVVQEASGEVADLRILSDCAIREVIMKPEFKAAAVPVDILSVDVNADLGPLQQQAERVFQVKAGDVFVGWLLNHEEVVDTTTKKAKFICENGHENPDPDHGTCYECGSPITTTSND